ncbi:DUF1758 domain-containing protein [Trichonephila clavipes]|nr:DUF1758 domain-containing protein [Trichonephila clavipes]
MNALRFTLITNTIKEELLKDISDVENLRILLTQLCDKFGRLETTHEKVLGLITDEDGYDKEFTEGDAREYLSFWSQFSKIHEDPDIVPEDKFQYLAQCIIPNSRAAHLINSFPMTADNYPKAIEQLKERFGRDSLLVQIFVHDLLSLEEPKKNLLIFRATGGILFAGFVLRVWERSRNSEDAVSKSDRTLENLMTFLCHEGEAEEIISLARSGFSNNYVNRNKAVVTSDVPTAEVLVYLKIGGQRRRVRALLDSGLQTSYIREEIVRHMKVYPIFQEVIHGLFGGKKTKLILHSVYTVEVSDFNNNFICKFEALSEKKICGFVPKINDPEILQELNKRKIKIFDSFYSGNEIDLLIGADVIGKILCGGDCVELTSVLTAVKTNLGWTVIGKPNETLNDSYCKDNVLVVLSLHVSNNSLQELYGILKS